MPKAPGRYTSYWRMMTPEKAKFGHRLWVTVNVVAPPAPSPVVHRNVTPGVIIRPPPPPRPQRSNPPLTSLSGDLDPQMAENVSKVTEFTGIFDIEKIVKILQEVNNNTDLAVDRLLDGA